ncbi:MAG: C10 family peptidase [Bacteroidales bacterium]|nr:C10 family peptidase [Bacteroidales bacterium]
MKNYLLFIFVLFFILCSSCNEISRNPSFTKDVENKETNYRITENMILDHLRLQGTPKTKTSETTIEPYVWQGDTVMYLVNDINGWQLVAADKRACPIVAYAENEHMSLADLENKEMYLRYWTQSVAEDIHMLRNGDYPIENENTKYWEIIEWNVKNHVATKTEEMEGWRLYRSILVSAVYNNTGPLIPTKWGSYDPWNSCFPYHYSGERMNVGSHNVAIAQVLYWANQEYGVPSYTYTDVTALQGDAIFYDDSEEEVHIAYPIFLFNDSSTVAWSQMKLSYDDSGRSDYVSYLMAKVRSCTDPVQEEGYSVTTDVNAINCFGLAASYGNYSVDTLEHYLYQETPVIVLTDVQTNNFYPNKLACIVDAYYRQTRTYDVYYIYDPDNTYVFDNISEEEDEGGPIVLPAGYDWFCQRNTTTMKFIAINWGFDGQGDGVRYAPNNTLWDWIHTTGTTSVQPHKMIYNIRLAN